MRKVAKWIPLLAFGVLILGLNNCTQPEETLMYAGSESCRECHERFYQLWAPSHHGLAMQGVDSSFIVSELDFSDPSDEIQSFTFTAVVQNDSLIMREEKDGAVRDYPAIHALGGKYIYYFLTPFDNGRLQVLPLAYDIKAKQWYNTPASAVRHFVDPLEDEELDWHNFAYTFNTSCHSCHVSQLNNNYDMKTGGYLTTWKEAGINCETCHGPSQEHVKIFRNIKDGEVPDDIGLIVTSTFTHEQNNSACAPCHAKMRSLTLSYPPGEKFFDHYDLVTLEDPDFFPDGRDLGENYTMTSWHQSECAKSGTLDCIHCHTSSGRYRFANENVNGACLPCHEERVKEIWDHSHHAEGTEGIKCIACHMPKTTFARMDRSDHSMRPPMPAATEAFESPNACNVCHEDQSTAWANDWVGKWMSPDYQKETLRNGRLLLDARTGEWEYLEETLAALYNNEFDEVFTTSFIRLMATLDNDYKWPAILVHANNPSPLVRGAVVNLVSQIPSPETKNLLIQAARDPFRVVRRAAASSISSFPQGAFSENELAMLQPVIDEYEKAFLARPDDWAAHYNLGNFYQNQEKLEEAIAAYEKAIELFPDAIAPLINQSFAYNLLGKKEVALNRLYRALEIDPENEATNLNFAMLMGEMGRLEEAENAMRKVAEINPESAQAAYNLSVILAQRKPDEALEWSKKAYEISPMESKYGYSYAFYLNQDNQQIQAITLLTRMIEQNPAYLDSYLLLSSIHEVNKDIDQAKKLIQSAIDSKLFQEEDQQRLQQKLDLLNSPQK